MAMTAATATASRIADRMTTTVSVDTDRVHATEEQIPLRPHPHSSGIGPGFQDARIDSWLHLDALGCGMHSRTGNGISQGGAAIDQASEHSHMCGPDAFTATAAEGDA